MLGKDSQIQQSTGSTTEENASQKSTTTGAGAQTNPQKTVAEDAGQKKAFDAEKFAALARRQKAQLEAERRAKTEFERNQVLSEKQKLFDTDLMDGKKKPFDFIKKHLGLTYEDLTEMQLNDGHMTEKMELTSKLSELDQWKKDQEELRSKEKEESERAQSQREQEDQKKQIDDFKKGIPSKLEKNEKLDLVLAFLEPEEQSEEIFGIIEAHWASEEEKVEKDSNYQPSLLSVDEAAEILEEALNEKFMKYVPKSKKFGHMLKQASNPAQPAKDKNEPSFTMSKTLTNDNVSSSPSFLSPKNESDRMKRALSALGANNG